MTTQPVGLVCWKCGSDISDLPYPFGRTAACTSCDAELHVCRLCEFFDTTVADQCREPIAEQVKEKERANFCDYFKAKPYAYVAHDSSKTAQAKAQLEALFGGNSQDSNEHDQPLSAEDIARKNLEDLFKK